MPEPEEAAGPGFTNQDAEHLRDRQDGLQPYVLARDCNGQVAAAAPAYLVMIEQALDAVAARQERARRLEAIGAATARVGGTIPWASTGARHSSSSSSTAPAPTWPAWTG